MGLSSAVQWWEEWQLRILVLASLAVQCYLAMFASARKKHIRALFRFSIWLAYLGGDALAIYGLAMLFNRQKKPQYKAGSRDLEVFWAPILLIHLGGQAFSISAFNIEDNELWRRHIVTSVSQVAVALYVFIKSWSPSADQRLLAAAIVLFVIGSFKCFDKPSALKRSSFSSIVSTFNPSPRTESTDREVESEEYIQKARDFMQRNEETRRSSSPDSNSTISQEDLERLENLSTPDKLFVDFAYSFPNRLTKLESFWLLDTHKVYAYGALCKGLSKTFDLIYSKVWKDEDQNTPQLLCGDILSGFLWLITLIVPIVPIGLFHGSHKEAYRGIDTNVTFILLYVTYFLEIATTITWSYYLDNGWSNVVFQHNLIGFLARKKRHKKIMAIMHFLRCKGLLDQYFQLEPCYSSKDITDLVSEHAKDGWLNFIMDLQSYSRFNDSRGHWTLERNKCEEIFIQRSIEKPFDESIILWHLATDFCSHRMGASPDSDESANRCRQISNYMMHLLFANPEMLLPSSRRVMFTTAYSELENILQGEDVSLLDEKELTEKIIDRAENAEYSFISDSWTLAKDLMQLGDEKKMWRVIKGVWIEMLCFSAGRCRGYLHAKSLGSGGEYLTVVSLVMSYVGLETFAERQQRVQLWLSNEERVSIARQNIEDAKNQADADASAEVQVVVSS
ncbi:uncharacterized protein LOC102713584 [Oryza brachyantha]|uniref:DUF4220 domain-containing protein n=1 Tax=Oryza brachyantha TaxID=4533 RepID=J3N6T2_ORYBR|nr:uncharacterized protein LOC102713584 [Oryza brachyantha]XP_040385044.1 uncharacterized protein LOC102713584 [Oryza brachyantha]